jgi:hypothetical protein
MQRQVKIAGELTPCPGCKRQPKHYHDGRGNRHFLECSPCQNRTPAYSTFNEAVAAWESQRVNPTIRRQQL